MNATSTERKRIVDRIAAESYDLVVVGGGIAGTGVARDASRRGLETLLVEQTDFGAGTTAGSTRLIHGGLRYLEQLEFGLVFESTQERETVAELAPHLVDPVTFVVPQYDENLLERVKLRLGMILYDALSYGKTMPRHERLSGDELREFEPAVSGGGLQGGFLYHDRQCRFVERLCVENVVDAVNAGADVLNHAEATSIRTDGTRATGVVVRDELSGRTVEVESDAVVNAAGPWADDVVEAHVDERMVRPAKGIHLVVPSLTDHALTLPTTDGRVVFVVPWDGKSLVGTTDTDYEGDPSEAVATEDDVAYLLEEVGRHFPGLDADDVLYTYAGVRPLYGSGAGGDSASVSRDHEVVDHAGDCNGLFSLVGAKITPYRRAAADLTDAVADYLGEATTCDTADVPLPGARGTGARTDALPADVLDHLESVYGTRASLVVDRAERDERLGESLCEHTDDVLAQVTVAVEAEHARRLTDVLFRRCTVGHAECEGRDAVDDVADHMAELLDWSDARTRDEVDRYERVIDRRHAHDAAH